MVREYPKILIEYDRQLALFTSMVEKIRGKWKRVECDEWSNYINEFGQGLIYSKIFYLLGPTYLPFNQFFKFYSGIAMNGNRCHRIAARRQLLLIAGRASKKIVDVQTRINVILNCQRMRGQARVIILLNEIVIEARLVAQHSAAVYEIV